MTYANAIAETDEWRKAMFSVNKEMEDRVGKGPIQSVYKTAGFVAPK